ncbi:MAG: hypothetical protein AAFQ80_14325 [Cyanobacteria bacterium J06621_8]
MIRKSLLKIFLTSAGLLGAMTTAVTAQEQPECFIIDSSGKLTDLTEFCNVSKERSPEAVSTAVTTPKSECFIIDNAGKRTELTEFCDVSKKRAPRQDAAKAEAPNGTTRVVVDPNLVETGVVLDDNLLILGENNVLSESGAIDSAYYIDNAIGSDFVAYVRRFKTAPTSRFRQTQREDIFQVNNPFNRTIPASERLTSILRQGRGDVPFLIYRY